MVSKNSFVYFHYLIAFILRNRSNYNLVKKKMISNIIQKIYYLETLGFTLRISCNSKFTISFNVLQMYLDICTVTETIIRIITDIFSIKYQLVILGKLVHNYKLFARNHLSDDFHPLIFIC